MEVSIRRVAAATRIQAAFRETISDLDKKGKDGLYDIEKFPIIHIDNFGKFVPDKRNIRHANMCIKEKNNGKS